MEAPTANKVIDQNANWEEWEGEREREVASIWTSLLNKLRVQNKYLLFSIERGYYETK